MEPTVNRSDGSRSYLLLLWLILPLASFVFVLAGGGTQAQGADQVPPDVVALDGSPQDPDILPADSTIIAPASDGEEQSQTAVLPTPVPSTEIPAQAAELQTQSPAPSVMTDNPPDTTAEFLALYGDQLYPTLDSMPADLLAWYLYWVERVAQHYDVPEEDILAVHYAELMGNGFRPLETRRSSARAAGPGQIIPQTWNGWSCGRNQTTFMTDPQSIINCGGLGTDFDGDGIANVDSLPDNLAATARHIKNDGISTSLRSNQANHEAALREALSRYNSNKSYWQAPAITQRYADIGVAWMRDNAALIPVYIEVYVGAA